MVIEKEWILLFKRISIEVEVIKEKKLMILLYFMQIFYAILFASKIFYENSKDNLHMFKLLELCNFQSKHG